MIARWIVLLAASIMLAACSDENTGGPVDTDAPPPSPLLFEIANTQGELEGWLFGTIHALPDGTRWRTKALSAVVTEADFLLVEITKLNDSAATAKIYTELATFPGPSSSLKQSVSPQLHDKLDALINRSQFEREEFDRVETWAAALMLAQVAQTGKSENGVDRALIKDFRGRPIEEFEGVRAQLSIFDQLAFADQRALVEGVITEAQTADSEPARLRNAWLAGDEPTLIAATQEGIMADPELREALLVKRNQDWIAQLVPMLKGEGEPLIAVGAGHLVGPDGMPAMLEAEGYKVKRIQ